MKKYLLSVILCAFLMPLSAQDTFSIVAVDTLNGQIGSAGASCIDNNDIAGGAIIISDIIPGRGAIHTQSYWISANQVNAHNRMLLGESPDEIIAWLQANDAQAQPAKRQYGIVDTDSEGHPRSAAFTGSACMDWKGHIAGVSYSIQGNILLGQQIIDSIEAGFLHTEGTLADKLMAALQGANVPGADSRCLSEGVSSLSAFLRVANPTDDPDSLYLDLNVAETPFGVEPITALQELYDEWKQLTGLHEKQQPVRWQLTQNPAGDHCRLINKLPTNEAFSLVVYQTAGQAVLQRVIGGQSCSFPVADWPAGLYLITLSNSSGYCQTLKMMLK